MFYNRENWVSFEYMVCICLVNMVNCMTSRPSLCFGLYGPKSARIWTGKQKSLCTFQLWRIIIWRVRVLHKLLKNLWVMKVVTTADCNLKQQREWFSNLRGSCHALTSASASVEYGLFSSLPSKLMWGLLLGIF